MKTTPMLYAAMALLLAFPTGCSRMQVVPEGERMLRQVFPVAMEKDRIYDCALEWMAKNFSASGEEVLVRDREKGRLIARGTGYYHEYLSVFVKRPFSYTMTVDVRDTRYRVTIDNLNVYYENTLRGRSALRYRFEYDRVLPKLRRLCDDLNGHLTSLLKEKEGRDGERNGDDDW
ncbi:MAG: DUF4468 domain-containing protein [Spirochaetes bacterium]|nr:DUF4468 domain-containing protein [Spirochaetota bacterium]